jgi:hypothetical protein
MFWAIGCTDCCASIVTKSPGPQLLILLPIACSVRISRFGPVTLDHLGLRHACPPCPCKHLQHGDNGTGMHALALGMQLGVCCTPVRCMHALHLLVGAIWLRVCVCLCCACTCCAVDFALQVHMFRTGTNSKSRVIKTNARVTKFRPR